MWFAKSATVMMPVVQRFNRSRRLPGGMQGSVSTVLQASALAVRGSGGAG